MPMSSDAPLKETPLTALHEEMGARMVPFAGYRMPVQFAGIMAEHRHTREKASLFDVSHMGQAELVADGMPPARALETLVPGDLAGLVSGQMRYTLLTNAAGGILDDLMVTNAGDKLLLVVNASRKDADFAHIETALAGQARLRIAPTQALLALQGPAAAEVLSRHAPGVEGMAFLTAARVEIDGIACSVSRSGYTGEDGYEISVPGNAAEDLARRLLNDPEVEAAGLGARDSLRLEAGLCLYGNDIDETTTPVEAALTWTIAKRRRAEGGFPGADIILRQLAEGPTRKRVGIRPDGRAPARAHTEITDADGVTIGEVTSGGFGPSVDGPVAMGYVRADMATPGTALNLMVRGKALSGRVDKLPFVPHRYYRA